MLKFTRYLRKISCLLGSDPLHSDISNKKGQYQIYVKYLEPQHNFKKYFYQIFKKVFLVYLQICSGQNDLTKIIKTSLGKSGMNRLKDIRIALTDEIRICLLHLPSIKKGIRAGLDFLI